MDDREFYVKVVSDLVEELGTIPTPRELTRYLKKDSTVNFKDIVKTFSYSCYSWYDNLIKEVKAELKKRGTRAGVYGVRPMGNASYHEKVLKEKVARVKAAQTKANQVDAMQEKVVQTEDVQEGTMQMSKEKVKPLVQVSDKQLAEKVIQIYDRGDDLTMETMAIFGLSAEEVLRRVCRYLNESTWSIDGLTKRVVAVLRERSATETEQKVMVENKKEGGEKMPKTEEKAKQNEKTPTEKGRKKRVKASDFRDVMRKFAIEHLRWPIRSEVIEFARQKESGWMTPESISRKYGKKEKWADQFFPEGLPDGFTDSLPLRKPAGDKAKKRVAKTEDAAVDKTEVKVEIINENEAVSEVVSPEERTIVPVKIVVPKEAKVSGVLQLTIQL